MGKRCPEKTADEVEDAKSSSGEVREGLRQGNRLNLRIRGSTPESPKFPAYYF